jgi:hypothetical protein
LLAGGIERSNARAPRPSGSGLAGGSWPAMSARPSVQDCWESWLQRGPSGGGTVRLRGLTIPLELHRTGPVRRRDVASARLWMYVHPSIHRKGFVWLERAPAAGSRDTSSRANGQPPFIRDCSRLARWALDEATVVRNVHVCCASARQQICPPPARSKPPERGRLDCQPAIRGRRGQERTDRSWA